MPTLRGELDANRGAADPHCLNDNDEGSPSYTTSPDLIPVLLQERAESARHHAGVVLADDAVIQADDIGGLLYSPSNLILESGAASWEDRVVFLRRRQRG